MRVWDFDPKYLCNKHLLAQHNEIHTIWNVHTKGLSGWRRHPEVKRWAGHLPALFLKHAGTADEMERRGFQHKSPIPLPLVGAVEDPEPWQPLGKQLDVLWAKRHEVAGCDCWVRTQQGVALKCQ